MVHFLGGKQRNKGHKRRVDESLKGMKGGFDPCCIHMSASQLITEIRRGDELSSCEKAKGSNQCK